MNIHMKFLLKDPVFSARCGWYRFCLIIECLALYTLAEESLTHGDYFREPDFYCKIWNKFYRCRDRLFYV